MAATINTGQGPSGSATSSALNVTAAGLLKTGKGTIATVIALGAGTLTINDCASGPVAANEIYSAAVTSGQVVDLKQFPFFAGLYISALPSQISVAFS